MTRLIGLDIGTSSAKGIAIDQSGAVIAEAERSYPLSTPRAGWSEQDPRDWWTAASEVLELLEARTSSGIGLTGQMHGLVVLGEGDELLRPAILWNDGRSQPQCDAIEASLGVDRLVALSGNRALAGFTAPKLRWLAENEPSVFARVRRVMLPKDYVRLRLCGAFATDVSDASGTLLLDVGARAWSDALCSAFGVDAAWLPPVLESGAVSGLAYGDAVPVAAGAGDQAAGAVGVGAVVEGGPASVVVGTSGVVFAPRRSFSPDPEGRLHAFCHAADGTWHVMGVMLSAAGALRWLRDATDPGASFSDLISAAAGWPPGVEGLRFAPYLAGERTPHADADARAAFVGLGLRHDRGALVRAVLEGVAYGLRDSLDLVAAVGPRPPVGRLSGGGAASSLWSSIIAAVLELPLERTAAAECVRVGARIEPEPSLVAAYAEQRAGFEALYPALRALRDA
jgi:xylulokinase